MMVSIETEFHAAANAAALRSLHRDGDIDGLLQYALLLASLEASQHAQIQWLAKEAAAGWSSSIQQWHYDLAAELLGGSGG
jgi:hypothetical protein